MTDLYEKPRKKLIKTLKQEGIHDPLVLEAISLIPRESFLPPELHHRAYENCALPIRNEQTISQPFIVAFMTQALQLKPDEWVLEVGTGSGYQLAILAHIAYHVYSLERFALLAKEASERLASLNISNVDIHIGDGSQGLPDMSPFDAIMITACAPRIPLNLVKQLHPEHGRMVLPVADQEGQALYYVKRDHDQWHATELLKVRFVPLIGKFGYDEPDT